MFKIRLLVLASLCSVVAASLSAVALAQVDRLDGISPRAADMPLIGDVQGVFELNGNVFSNATSISVSEVNGVRITDVTDNGQKFRFAEDPASGITCTVTKRYSSNDMAAVEKEQPELNMFLAAIPKTLGDSTIEVHVDVTTKYHAADAKELKEQHPDVYKLYMKYTKMSGNGIPLNLNGQPPLQIEMGARGQATVHAEDHADDRQRKRSRE